MHVSQNWIDIAYLIAACLFVLGIKGLTKPKLRYAVTCWQQPVWAWLPW